MRGLVISTSKQTGSIAGECGDSPLTWGEGEEAAVEKIPGALIRRGGNKRTGILGQGEGVVKQRIIGFRIFEVVNKKGS